MRNYDIVTGTYGPEIEPHDYPGEEGDQDHTASDYEDELDGDRQDLKGESLDGASDKAEPDNREELYPGRKSYDDSFTDEADNSGLKNVSRHEAPDVTDVSRFVVYASGNQPTTKPAQDPDGRDEPYGITHMADLKIE